MRNNRTKPAIAKRWIDRKKTILELRKQGATLKELGERYGVTRERIRQVLRIYEYYYEKTDRKIKP